jgi:hypothetical protein
MPQLTQAQSYNQEGRILLAIQSIKEGHIQSIRASAMSYDVVRDRGTAETASDGAAT